MNKSLNDSLQSTEQQSISLITLMLCCAGVIALGVAAWFHSSHKQRHTAPATVVAVMTPEEREYVKNIHVRLLGTQPGEGHRHVPQVTLQGEMVNAGTRAVDELQLNLQFVDEANEVFAYQVEVLGTNRTRRLVAGETGTFEMTFEKPRNWNGLPATISVIHLQLLP